MTQRLSFKMTQRLPFKDFKEVSNSQKIFEILLVLVMVIICNEQCIDHLFPAPQVNMQVSDAVIHNEVS